MIRAAQNTQTPGLKKAVSKIKRKQVIDGITKTFELYEKKMYHIACAVLQDPYQAEDAVMDAFVRLLEKADGYNGAAGENGGAAGLEVLLRDPYSDDAKRMMITLIRWAAIDIYRKNQRNRSHEITENESLRDLAADKEADGMIPDGSDIGGLIGVLPPIYRDVLHERFQNEYSVRETAQVLGITESTVRKRQERGLKMLRERKEGCVNE